MALAKEGHFARAAAACHVSQPTLSAAIQQLEVELGVPIVQRGQRFQGLTREGRLVLEAAQRMAGERDRLRERLRGQRDGCGGTLRIGVLGSTVPLLKTLILPFSECFPDVNLHVMLQSPFDVQQAFEAASSDVVITYLDQRLRRYCRTHVLYTEQYDLLIRKGTTFSGRKSAAWEDLTRLPLCLLAPDSPLFGKAESEILAGILTKTPHIVTNAIWMVMDHVRTGKWASVLPRAGAHHGVRRCGIGSDSIAEHRQGKFGGDCHRKARTGVAVGRCVLRACEIGGDIEAVASHSGNKQNGTASARSAGG